MAASSDKRDRIQPAVDPTGPRRALMVGAVFLLLGLALVGMGPSEPGMIVTLAALVMMIYGIHTFGRLGPA
jgi:hypothetical protein